MVHNNTLCIDMLDGSKIIINDVTWVELFDSELSIGGGHLGKEKLVINTSLEDIKTLEIFHDFGNLLKVAILSMKKDNFCSDQVADLSMTNEMVKVFYKNGKGIETEYNFAFSDIDLFQIEL